MNHPHARLGLQVFGLGQRIAVARAVAQVDVHIDKLLLCDDGPIEPRAGRKFIPKVVAILTPRRDVPRRGRLRFRNLIQRLLRERRLDRDVHGRQVDARPRGAQDNMRGLRIEPEIEFMPRARRKFGSSVCGFRLPPMITMPCVSSANSGSIETARAIFVSGPAA